jgi:hypothetical protein
MEPSYGLGRKQFFWINNGHVMRFQEQVYNSDSVLRSATLAAGPVKRSLELLLVVSLKRALEASGNFKVC